MTEDRRRTDLHNALRATIPDEYPEAADTMMSLLPPVGWADVATKHDLVALRREMDARFEALEHRIDARVASAVTRVILAVLAMNVSLAGVGVALAGG